MQDYVPIAAIVVTILLTGAGQVGILLFYLGGDKRAREDHDRQLADHEKRIRLVEAEQNRIGAHCEAVSSCQ
jgi:hypothetical protein